MERWEGWRRDGRAHLVWGADHWHFVDLAAALTLPAIMGVGGGGRDFG